MPQTPQVDLDALWNWVVAEIKKETSTPSFWRSLESARPLTLENREELILGFDESQGHNAGLLTNDKNKNHIEQILERATKVRLRIRVIHGTTMEDWEAEKRIQAEGARMVQQNRQQVRQQAQAGDSWENIGEQLVRRYNDYPNRMLASAQGRFLSEAVTTLSEAHTRLMGDPPTEEQDRNYARVLERIGERIRVPPPMIAYLVNERRTGG